MSSATPSPSPVREPGAAPAPAAILVAAHGDGGDLRRNAAIRTIAERLARRVDVPVAWAVLKEPDSFPAARADLGTAAEGPVAVYPFFMSDGYFVRVKLPRMLAASGFPRPQLLPTFGTDPLVVDLLERRLRSVAALQGGCEPKDFRILLVGHGSGSGEPASRLRTEAVAAELGYRGLGRVHVAFIEEAPFVEDAFRDVDPQIVVGFFASEGTHALDDVATLVAERPQVLHHIAAIGSDLGVADMIAARIAEAAGSLHDGNEACISGETA
ncbi:sirohydrochlorin chelatase [Prosthecomicrobium sp. N25]|uniref:sirohydrochlorin chelatase n=1 Tax=Prosthecomicrobium sp. N25 TaxID=3129254 RepID=UPI0030769B61